MSPVPPPTIKTSTRPSSISVVRASAAGLSSASDGSRFTRTTTSKFFIVFPLLPCFTTTPARLSRGGVELWFYPFHPWRQIKVRPLDSCYVQSHCTANWCPRPHKLKIRQINAQNRSRLFICLQPSV
nr:MAG TPA: hypothetical protein [Caudoviricetes sp.]